MDRYEDRRRDRKREGVCCLCSVPIKENQISKRLKRETKGHISLFVFPQRIAGRSFHAWECFEDVTARGVKYGRGSVCTLSSGDGKYVVRECVKWELNTRREKAAVVQALADDGVGLPVFFLVSIARLLEGRGSGVNENLFVLVGQGRILGSTCSEFFARRYQRR